MRSKLLDITITNLGCIGSESLTVSLDNILCLVGNNNSGKSTVLRAYELAVGTEKYNVAFDRSKLSEGDTEIEISVHIPEGVANIAEKWKVIDKELRIVKSRWTWDLNGAPTRETYDPDLSDYSPDGNAAGLDNVFTSRLPKPFRIGALESPEAELKNLLKLIVEPISIKLKKSLGDAQSEMSKALRLFNLEVEKPVKEEAKKIEKYNKEITKGHSSIFPDLSIDLSIGMGELDFNPIKALQEGSNLNIKEYNKLVDWNQQGTGSQRALFWSLLQVRSKLQSINDYKVENEKAIKAVEREIKSLEKAKEKAKTEATKITKQENIDLKKVELNRLSLLNIEDELENNSDDISLPGYMLLIDEPEIALHPNGIRAASNYLYDLAKDNSWQIMLTTHSPLFINPFEDNTTIVRLTRSEGSPSPLTYKSDDVEYSVTEKEQLSLLNNFDQNLAEMFFGQQPVIIEGDTEFAAFHKVMDMDMKKYPLGSRPLMIRARGKFTIIPIIKMLNHFKVNFSVLHDSDYPINKKGGNNNVWSGNKSITDEIKECRVDGRKVNHRISISTFEIEHLGVDVDKGMVVLPSGKAKPFEMYAAIGTNQNLKLSVEKILDSLIDEEYKQQEPFKTKTASDLPEVFINWVTKHKITDPRFLIK